MDNLQIIYCKDCKYFCEKIINKHCAQYSCKSRESYLFSPDSPELLINRKCYKELKKAGTNGKNTN